MQSHATQDASTAASGIRIYNTLSRTKEPFETITPGKVGIYLCGPTVYKEAHIGHMVGPVIFDTIARFLVHKGFEVNWVVNITDVDDKLIAESTRRGIPMSLIAVQMTADYCANLLAMGVDQITHMPRATENIDEIIRFIEELIEKDYAYAVDGDVFFDVTKDADYGKLTNRTVESQQGEGGGAAAKKRSSGDFALWKKAKSGEPFWASPWGDGRPGWHIECSAMSRRLLGQTFDIHGGGLDLIFPHHENEIAQSECCHDKPMARYWMHNGLMRATEAGKVGGRTERQREEDDLARADTKLSRSKGAGGLRNLIERQGGERIRFFLLRTHYRSTIVFSEEAVQEAGTGLDKFYLFFDRYQRITGQSFYLDNTDEDRKLIERRAGGEIESGSDQLMSDVKIQRDSFLAKMDDDFNTGAATSDLFQLVGTLNKFADQQQLDDPGQRQDSDLASFARATETLRELSAILGLFRKPVDIVRGTDDDLLSGLAELLIELRASARGKKDFQTADLIRDRLDEIGITLEDRKDGTEWRKQ